MARFEHVIFVCTRERPPDDPKGCCSAKGSVELLSRLKNLIDKHGLKGRVRATSSGCLDFCAKGCTVAVFSADTDHPETWYTRTTPDDAEALFESHILNNSPLVSHIEAVRGRQAQPHDA